VFLLNVGGGCFGTDLLGAGITGGVGRLLGAGMTGGVPAAGVATSFFGGAISNESSSLFKKSSNLCNCVFTSPSSESCFMYRGDPTEAAWRFLAFESGRADRRKDPRVCGARKGCHDAADSRKAASIKQDTFMVSRRGDVVKRVSK
jgi:hypothetical protein